MVMVRNSLPVSDIKIYSTDTHPHPPATQIHTYTYTPSSSWALPLSNSLLQMRPPLLQPSPAFIS